MKAIILAAGRGSRMGDLTDVLPKCRQMLHDKELIQWQIESIQGAGINDLAIVRGYLAESFTFPIDYFENSRWDQTNMVSSLLEANSWLEQDTCVTSYSDIVYSADVVTRLMQAPGDIVMTYDPNWKQLWSMRFEDPLSDAETFRLDGNRVIEIGNRASSIEEIEGQYMGLVKYTPAGWNQVKDYLNQFDTATIDKMDMTSLLKGLIDSGIEISATPIADQWFEVDSEQDLKLYSKLEINFS